jgi:tetratricopeptide (TPR) repeat protein
MAESAPENFFAHLALAHAAQALERWDESALSAHRATTLAPRNGAGWNLLGYAHLRSGRRIEAVAAFKRYADVCPFEPNASDSLGEALLEAGQLEDAEDAFRQALTRSKGAFTQAWGGLAAVHAHRGDWPAARAALATQRKHASQHTERLRTELMVAWTWAAENRFDTAVQVTTSLEREAKRAGLDAVAAEAAVLRGQLELLAGRPASALAAFTAAGRLGNTRMTKRQELEHRVTVLTGLTVAQARLGRVRHAQRGLVKLAAFVRDELPGPLAGDALVFAHGAVSRVRTGPDAAIESWLNCSPSYALCRLSLLEAQERAGKKSEGEETRAALIKSTRREPSSWFLRARLEAKRRISGT